MLIGSEKTPLFAFLASSIKFTSGVITPAAAKARSAQGASQAEFLREGIFRCRAGVGGQGKPCGDGKPAGPDVPP